MPKAIWLFQQQEKSFAEALLKPWQEAIAVWLGHHYQDLRCSDFPFCSTLGGANDLLAQASAKSCDVSKRCWYLRTQRCMKLQGIRLLKDLKGWFWMMLRAPEKRKKVMIQNDLGWVMPTIEYWFISTRKIYTFRGLRLTADHRPTWEERRKVEKDGRLLLGPCWGQLVPYWSHVETMLALFEG